MNLLLDYAACERFAYLLSLEVDGQQRGYYVLQAEDHKLALLVTRGAKLPELAGQVVDVTLGWDNGYPGFVFYPGQMHTKITAFGRIDAPHERTLSEVLSKAPERRRKE
ncbi:MAG: hypothetical protein V9H69_24090 [Anaerolineae bacterium]